MWIRKGSFLFSLKEHVMLAAPGTSEHSPFVEWGLPVKAQPRVVPDVAGRVTLRPPYPGLSPQVQEWKAPWLSGLAPSVPSSGHLLSASLGSRGRSLSASSLNSCHFCPLSSQENKTHQTKPKQTRPVPPKEKMSFYSLFSGAF